MADSNPKVAAASNAAVAALVTADPLPAALGDLFCNLVLSLRLTEAQAAEAEGVRMYVGVGTVAQRWHGVGMALARRWHGVGTALARRWHGVGVLLVARLSSGMALARL